MKLWILFLRNNWSKDKGAKMFYKFIKYHLVSIMVLCFLRFVYEIGDLAINDRMQLCVFVIYFIYSLFLIRIIRKSEQGQGKLFHTILSVLFIFANGIITYGELAMNVGPGSLLGYFD